MRRSSEMRFPATSCGNVPSMRAATARHKAVVSGTARCRQLLRNVVMSRPAPKRTGRFFVLFDVWEDAENITNRTVKAPPKTGQNAAPGGISRPQFLGGR